MDINSVSTAYKDAWIGLLSIKETQLRISMIDQANDAVDQGIHAGGAFSAMIPMVSLFYGGYINFDAKNPTKVGLDQFVLSKGHAVAAMASVYADLGYFDKALLKNSRCYDSLLNGHPGPKQPGVLISTGPLGEGICVAEGYAMAGRKRFNAFTLTGDGELQEGMPWEAVIYAAQAGLDNLCVLIDCNNGQLDIYDRLVVPTNRNLAGQFASFGWNVMEADARSIEGVMNALNAFKYEPRNGKPTAIVCKSQKGEGSFSNEINKHKATVTDALHETEHRLQTGELKWREKRFLELYAKLDKSEQAQLKAAAKKMFISIDKGIGYLSPAVELKRAPKRDKKIKYDANALPKLEVGAQALGLEVIRDCMKVFAKDERVVSIDSDLSSTSGLMAGIGYVDKNRGINVGIAEANMMNIAEAYAVLGYNSWCSTFCPFFNWQVMRRIAVGQQERLEDMEGKEGWLNAGHGLDITFLATAANLDTVVNGATHMGNDDIMVFETIPELHIIDISCSQQLIGVMKWIMDGNKGLVYLRIMRSGSATLYGGDFVFKFGKGYVLAEGKGVAAVSSGRGVHECLEAKKILAGKGLNLEVIDMPSFDGEMLIDLYKKGMKILITEQNNGYLARKFYEYAAKKGIAIDPDKVSTSNLLDAAGNPRFIHSGTYGELTKGYGLDAQSIAKQCLKIAK